jgi:hypothetical protein
MRSKFACASRTKTIFRGTPIDTRHFDRRIPVPFLRTFPPAESVQGLDGHIAELDRIAVPGESEES